MNCDLHIHTTNSDGSMKVEDVVYYAKKQGLEYIAVTDHDTMHGVQAAVETGKKLGVHVVPGLETTAIDLKRNRPVHILGYYPKYPEHLEKMLATTLENRRNQKLEMIKKIEKLYPLVELEHIKRYARESQSIYESHIMQTLCDLGYTNAPFGELMEQLISKKGCCYAPSHYPSVDTVIDTMNAAKAIIVIAHPEQFDSFELVEELAIDKRIQGLEYDHPRNHEVSRKRIRQLSENYGLIMTGGSDFHGQYAKEPHTIGSYGCSENVIRQMEELL